MMIRNDLEELIQVGVTQIEGKYNQLTKGTPGLHPQSPHHFA
jgi:hypothetical protein